MALSALAPAAPHRLSRRGSRTLAAVSAVGLLGAGLFGCAAQKQLTAGESVRDAVTQLSDTHALTVSFGLEDNAAVEAALQKDGSMTPAQAKALMGARLKVTVVAPDGKKLSDLKSTSPQTLADFRGGMDIAVEVPDGNLAEFRVVDGGLYLHVGLKALSALSGQDLGKQLQAARGQVPPVYADVVDAIAHDGWISIPASAVDRLQKLAQSQTATSVPSPDASKMAELQQRLMKALQDNTKITDAGGGKYVATVSLKPVVQAFTSAISSLVGGAAVPGLSDATDQLKDVPDTATAELTIKDGALTAVRTDVAQFASPKERASAGIDHLWLGLNMQQEGTVTKPEKAVDFDPTALLALAQMGGSLGAGTSAGGSAGTSDNGGLLSDQDLQNLLNEASGGTQS